MDEYFKMTFPTSPSFATSGSLFVVCNVYLTQTLWYSLPHTTSPRRPLVCSPLRALVQSCHRAAVQRSEVEMVTERSRSETPEVASSSRSGSLSAVEVVFLCVTGNPKNHIHIIGKLP